AEHAIEGCGIVAVHHEPRPGAGHVERGQRCGNGEAQRKIDIVLAPGRHRDPDIPHAATLSAHIASASSNEIFGHTSCALSPTRNTSTPFALRLGASLANSAECLSKQPFTSGQGYASP